MPPVTPPAAPPTPVTPVRPPDTIGYYGVPFGWSPYDPLGKNREGSPSPRVLRNAPQDGKKPEGGPHGNKEETSEIPNTTLIDPSNDGKPAGEGQGVHIDPPLQ